MPQPIPIYTHYSSSSNVSPIKRVTATDISIIEEAEPCELHDKVNCKECTIATKSKMDQVLKRSISTNAVNTIKKRRSIINLHRTLSQTSCYSTGSTSENNINGELFDDFMLLLSGAGHHNRTDYMWEILPNESKIAYLRRLLERQQHEDDYEHGMQNDNLKTWTNSGRGSVMSHILNKSVKSSRAQTKKPHGSKSHDKRSRIIREVAEELYEQLLQQDLEAYEEVIDSDENFQHDHEMAIATRKRSQPTKQESIQTDEIQLKQDHERLDLKIKELNELLDKLSSFSPLPTPSTDEGNPTLNNETPVTTITKIPTKPYDKTVTVNHIPKRAAKEKHQGFMGSLASKSKNFMNMFKQKKKKKKTSSTKSI